MRIVIMHPVATIKTAFIIIRHMFFNKAALQDLYEDLPGHSKRTVRRVYRRLIWDAAKLGYRGAYTSDQDIYDMRDMHLARLTLKK